MRNSLPYWDQQLLFGTVRVSTEIQQQCPVPPCQSIDVVHDGSLLVIVWFQVCDVLVCKVGV